jgi:D-glycerate 3-kinase
MSDKVRELIEREGLPADFAATVERIHAPVAGWIAEAHARAGRPVVIGICGGQGTGKTTLVLFLAALLQERGLRCVSLSIDDLYKTKAERERLARAVHPLLATRGVPGTHDVDIGLALFDRLAKAGPNDVTALPCFDKSVDDRAPEADWPRFTGRPDVILFEGWCVGAAPEPDAAVAAPINALERDEDQGGHWRRYVNDELAGPYRLLFGRLDELIFLRPPDFAHVLEWRTEQERKLQIAKGGGPGVMSPAALARFVMYYERLTRAMMHEMPARADLVIDIDAQHRMTGFSLRSSPPQQH